MLGSTHELFSSKQTYYLSLPNAEGVVSGASVMIAGVKSGAVEDVSLEPQKRSVKITMSLSARAAESIRQDSVANVTTHGVLGDKVIVISAGDPSLPQKEPGNVIPAEATSTFSNLFGTRGDRLLNTIDQVARHLDQLLVSTTRNGKMDKLMDGLVSITRSVSTTADLLNEQLKGIKLKQAVGNLNSLLGKADHGSGTVSGLINDPSLYDNAKALVGEVNDNRIARNLVRKAVEEGHEREAVEKEESVKANQGQQSGSVSNP
jgi:phospholipid/cholesterol/gamma-HCH transport system substrate-binding protein